MTARIDIRHSFRPASFKKLAEHPAVEEIDNFSMDEGRFFVHLKDGYEYAPNGYGQKGIMSFGSIKEANAELKKVIKLTGEK